MRHDRTPRSSKAALAPPEKGLFCLLGFLATNPPAFLLAHSRRDLSLMSRSSEQCPLLIMGLR